VELAIHLTIIAGLAALASVVFIIIWDKGNKHE